MKAIRWLACALAIATLALATIGLLGLRSAAPVTAGATLVVDDDGMGTAANCDSSDPTPYSTISAAVSAAAPWDTVQVCPGTYNEQVVINTANLTLSGPNAGVDPGCSGTRLNSEATIAWSTLTNVGTASTVVIAANGVTVDGFTIQNTNGTENQVSVLIGGHYVGDTHPSDGSNVRNNIISSGYNNVYVWQSSDSTIERNRVLASVQTQIHIRDNAAQGTRDALRNSVLNNCIDKAGVTSVGHSVAIGVTGASAQDFTGTLIQGNTMKNSGAGTGHFWGIDANLANGTVGEPVKIYGNTITDTVESGIRIENSNNYDVGGSSSSTGNTIAGSRGAVGGWQRGIATAGTSTGLSIQYNTISGHSSTSSNDGEIVVTTAGNTILHNTLFVADSAPGGAGGIGLRADSPSNVLGENTFQGDGQRMLVVGGASGPGLTIVDATASTFKTASGTTLDPNSQADLVSIEDRVRHHMDLPTNFVLVIFKANTTVATALNNATTPGAVQRAINAVPGSTVVVGPGTYNERVTIGKSVDIRGAQYGVDPTQPGARTTPANESIIDLTGLPLQNPNVLVEIADGVSNVSLAGFTLVGSPTSHYADEAIVRAWDNDIAIKDNIMNGYIGVLYKGPGQNLQVLRNRTVFNKNGLVVQPGTLNNATVSGNTFTLGSSAAGDEAAIYMTGASQVSVTGNTATGIAPNGRGLYGSNLTQVTASGNKFTGNKDAVSIFGSSTFITISNNDLSGSLRYGVNIKGQDVSIAGNKINNCGDSGVNIDEDAINTERVTVSNNDLSGSTNYGVKVNTAKVPETINAENNWWGTLSWYGYDAVRGIKDRVSGNVDWEPWKDSSLTTSYSKPTTTYVDDNNVGKSEGQPGSSGGVFGYNAFAAVQDGINNVAASTVNVAAGTYTEQLDIGKPLTLTGAGQASTIIKSPSVLATKFVTGANNNKPVVYIHDATGVTVQQLTVDGDGKGNGNYRMEGIAFYNAGGTVDHVTITRVRETPLSGAQHGGALIAYNTDGLPRTLNVSSNIISEYQKNGMALMGAGLTTTVTGNTVTGSGPTGVIAQNGIQLGFGATGTVDGNTVSNNSYTGPNWAATDVLVVSANVGITGNTLNNGQLGLYYIEGSGTISGNTVSATTTGVGRPDYWGIAVSDPPGLSPSPFEERAAPPAGGFSAAPMGAGVMTVVVSGNTLTGNGSADSVGLEADAGYGPEDIDLSASYNEISDWGHGVVTYACTGCVTSSAFLSVDIGPMNNIRDNDVGVGVYNDSSAVAVNFNYIVGNASFGVESDDTANTLDATHNWWGHPTGPYQPTKNPAGMGDRVSDYVLFDPWLTLGDSDLDTVPDTVDNCPFVWNPGQENFDAAPLDNGPSIPGDDGTVPRGDGLGDACDPDDDNDFLPDDLEAVGCGSGPMSARGDNTNDDNHDGNPAPPMGTDTADNGPSWDSDGDGVIDGYECAHGSNPLDRLSVPPALPDDPNDTDGDGLRNGWERRHWRTLDTVVDSDGDGLGDCTEAMDVNGNGLLTAADSTFIKQAFFGVIGKSWDFDINGNGLITVADAVLVQQAFFGVTLCK
jgi:hypothetical protein